MTPEVAVRTRLLAVSAVTTLVGTRVYTMVLPQNVTLPAIRLQLVDETIRETVDGVPGLIAARVQVDAYDSTMAGARSLGLAVHGSGGTTSPTGLQYWRGDLGSPAYTVKLMRRVLFPAPRYESEELRLYRVMQDYEVWVSDGVATV